MFMNEAENKKKKTKKKRKGRQEGREGQERREGKLRGGRENKEQREREDEWPLQKHRVPCPEPLYSYCCGLGLSLVHWPSLDDKTQVLTPRGFGAPRI